MTGKIQKMKNQINAEEIAKAIEKFESEVEFEFIPVIAPKSSYTEHVPWILSLILMFISIVVIDFIFQDSYQDRWIYYLMGLLFSVLFGFILDRLDWVDRFFISKKEQVRQVHEKAERIFFKKKLHESKSHNALLLYISVLEKRIVLLPDTRTHIEGLDQITQKMLQLLQASFKKQQYQQGIMAAIGHLSQELSDKHKKSSNLNNQFSNKLIWWDD